MRYRLSCISLAALALASGLCAATGRQALAAKAPIIAGCGEVKAPEKTLAMLHPLQPGPASLAGHYCLGEISGALAYASQSSLSPDGRHVLSARYVGISIEPLPSPGPERSRSGPPLLKPDLTPVGDQEADSRWSVDSRFVWASEQPRMRPRGGFATGPRRLVRLWPDGRVEPLPRFAASYGDVDLAAWTPEGLAVVQFGTRGGYYRPERPNPSPTVALVDGRAGKVLQTVSLSALVGPAVARPAILKTVPVRLPDGRLRAFFQVNLGRWVVWTQGDQPKPLPFNLGLAAEVQPVPGGQRILVNHGLTAAGMICERDDPCPPPKPVSGPAVSLYDLASGKLIWRKSATAVTINAGLPSAASPDGRLAVISLPGERGQPRPRLTLIALADGRVLQTLPAPGRGRSGFTRDGLTLWIAHLGTITLYTLDR